MKYHHFGCFLLLSCFVLLLCACKDDNETEASHLAGFQRSGCIVADFSFQDGDTEYKMNVLNKGMEKFTTQITLYTQGELDAYNKKNATTYKLMPEGTYKLSETVLTFSGGENSKEIKVTIFPDRLFDAIRADAGQYALPLKIGNQSATSSNSVIYVMNMAYPLLRLMDEVKLRLTKEKNELLWEAYTYEKKESTKTIPNKGNVSLNIIVPDNAREWLQTYNKKNNTDYQLLPVGMYELGKLTGTKGDNKCTVLVKVDRSILKYGNYILPVQLSGKNEYVGLDSDISCVKVINSDNYNDVGIEYDDGQNIIFHVKFAIDKEGLEMKNNDMEFFRAGLEKQWKDINVRFNGLDKNGKLERNYIFVPDLEDIIVYDFKDKDSHWNVPKNYNDRIDRKKYQSLIVYDFVPQVGEGGGGFGDSEGMSNILVVLAKPENIGKFCDHFAPEAYGTESIVHELGHFRGIVDTYLCRISAQNNPINGVGFEPEAGNMNNCYPPLDQCAWSDYEMSVMNINGAKKEHDLIYKCMRDYFPDGVEITVTENGEPTEGFTLKFYPVESGTIKKEPVRTHKSNGSRILLEPKPLFWDSDWNLYPWTFRCMYLVEAISQRTGNKGYLFMPCYEVHKQGIKDKVKELIDGKSVFKRTIDITSFK